MIMINMIKNLEKKEDNVRLCRWLAELIGGFWCTCLDGLLNWER